MLNKEAVLKKLKEKGIVYGVKYTVQAMHLWEDKKKFTINGYSVCENLYIPDKYENHLCPIPIEDYKVSEIEKAVISFIKKENKK